MVIDASALFEIMVDSPLAGQVEQATRSHDLHAPELVDAEVLSALVRCEKRGDLTSAQVAERIDDLRDAPIIRVPHLGLLWGAWQCSGGLSAYDALYVALAAELGCGLVTADRRLARSPGLGVPVTVIA